MTIELEALGFTGFYQGIWDQGENEYTEIHEQQYGEHEDFESLQFLDDWGFDEDYRDEVTKIYAHQYIDMLNEVLDTDMKLVSWRLRSPQYYNYSTDEIYCKVEIGDYKAFAKRLISLANNPRYHDAVAETIRRNHTSYDGFISFMTNDMEEWCDNMLEKEDDDRYISCMIGYLANAVCPGCLKQLNWDIYSYVSTETDLHYPRPESDDAKAEWEVYQKYGKVYTDWANEHPHRYENPNKSWGPKFIVLDWDEYNEMWSEYAEAYDAEQRRIAFERSLPKIPGLE
jgi:hypothetical protein